MHWDSDIKKIDSPLEGFALQPSAQRQSLLNAENHEMHD